MKCPFPGMDPYIERAAIWPDYHDRLIVYIGEQLQPQLRPKYAALGQDRLYVVEHSRPIYPDVSIVRGKHPLRGVDANSGGVAILADVDVEAGQDEPLVYEVEREEVRQPVLHIIELAAGNRLITSIEVLSPGNKTDGEGKSSYLFKRSEVWNADANLVEIDLLRGGESVVRVPDNPEPPIPRLDYLVSVSRRQPSRIEIYAIGLRRSLPRIRIPLTRDDPDVLLDLQAAHDRCWEAGPYPELLDYDGPPPGEMSVAAREWARKIAMGAIEKN